MPQTRVIVVTGAASGIGAAVANLLASPNVSLLLHSSGSSEKGRALLNEVEKSCQARGAKTQICYSDLSMHGAGNKLIKDAVNAFGSVDQLVSNAGYALKKSLSETSSQDLSQAFNTMAVSFFEMAHAAMPYMKKSECGSIVLTSSFVAHRYKQGELYPVTALAKAAAESLAMSLAAELAPNGITVNCVVPGYTTKDPKRYPEADWTKLPKPPMGRFGSADDIARTVGFLLSNNARYITGQRLGVDGGLQLG